MKLVVKKIHDDLNIEKYFIKNENGNSADSCIANKLGLILKKYRKILLKFNTESISNTDEIFFKTKEDGEAALKELEPYLVMCNLTEE